MTLLAWLVLFLLAIAVLAGTASTARKGRDGPLWKDVARALGYVGLGGGAALLLGALFLSGCLVIGVLWLSAIDSSSRLDGDLTGSVRDQDGVPAPQARVVLAYTCNSCPEAHEPRCETTADEFGGFRFQEPVSHPALVTGFAPGLVSEPVELFSEAGVPEVIDLYLVPEARIAGTLRDGAGQPLPWRKVVSRPPSGIKQSVETAAHGRFELRSLPPGRTHLTVAPTDQEKAAMAGTGRSWETERAMTRGLYVDLAPGETVEVRIPPAPTRFVQVHARVLENGIERNRYVDAVRVDNEAISDFGACIEHDHSCLTLGPGLHRFSTWARLGEERIPWSIEVEVPDVATFDYDLHIPYAYLNGSVRTSGGEPVPGAEIFWLPDDGQAYESSWPLGNAQEDGTFVRHVPARSQRLCARSDGRSSPWTVVQVKDQMATMKMPSSFTR